MNNNFKYNIVDDYDKIFDDKGNTFLAMRKIQWGESDKTYLDLRKWYCNADGEETPGKGFSFLTEEGPHELARVLVDNGYGHTDDIIDSIKDRDDFMTSLVECLNKEEIDKLDIELPEVDNGDYYDPSVIIE